MKGTFGNPEPAVEKLKDGAARYLSRAVRAGALLQRPWGWGVPAQGVR